MAAACVDGNQPDKRNGKAACVDRYGFFRSAPPTAVTGNAREGACGAIAAAMPLRVRAILLIHEDKGMITANPPCRSACGEQGA